MLFFSGLTWALLTLLLWFFDALDCFSLSFWTVTLFEEVTFLVTTWTLPDLPYLTTLAFTVCFLVVLLIFLEFNFNDGFFEIDADFSLLLASLSDLSCFVLSFEIDFVYFFWIEIYDI